MAKSHGKRDAFILLDARQIHQRTHGICQVLRARRIDKKKLRHIVRISCFGADTNTNKYDKDTHASRENAQIPLMLQHYWWSEECFIENGFKDILTSIRGNFYMNHLLKNELDPIRENGTFTSVRRV